MGETLPNRPGIIFTEKQKLADKQRFFDKEKEHKEAGANVYFEISLGGANWLIQATYPNGAMIEESSIIPFL